MWKVKPRVRLGWHHGHQLCRLTWRSRSNVRRFSTASTLLRYFSIYASESAEAVFSTLAAILANASRSSTPWASWRMENCILKLSTLQKKMLQKLPDYTNTHKSTERTNGMYSKFHFKVSFRNSKCIFPQKSWYKWWFGSLERLVKHRAAETQHVFNKTVLSYISIANKDIPG